MPASINPRDVYCDRIMWRGYRVMAQRALFDCFGKFSIPAQIITTTYLTTLDRTLRHFEDLNRVLNAKFRLAGGDLAEFWSYNFVRKLYCPPLAFTHFVLAKSSPELPRAVLRD